MPAFPLQYPMINGHRFSFASVEIFLPGNPVPFVGVKSINYNASLDPGKGYGTSSRKLFRTAGKGDSDGDIEMYRLEWENLKAALGIGGVGYGRTSWTGIIQYSEDFSPVVTDSIIGTRITKAEYSNSEGTDPTTVKLTLDIMLVNENGGSIDNPR